MALAQGLFDVVDEDTAALQAEFTGDQLAIAIQEERGWQHADAAIVLSDRFFSDKNGIVDAHFPSEFRDVFSAGVVHGYADDLETLWAVFLLQFDKPGHLDLARSAIGRPEVEENRFAAQVGKFELFSVQRRQSEIGGQVADELAVAGDSGAVVAGGANAGEQHGRDQGGDKKQNQRISFHG